MENRGVRRVDDKKKKMISFVRECELLYNNENITNRPQNMEAKAGGIDKTKY